MSSNTRQTADVAHVVGRKNLIINGDMKVSQRGNYITAPLALAWDDNDTYTVDRWIVDGNIGVNVTNPYQTINGVSADTLRCVTSEAYNGADLAITQKIEHFRTLSGKTVTYSFLYRTNMDSAKVHVNHSVNGGNNGYVGSILTADGSWYKHEVTFTVIGGLGEHSPILTLKVDTGDRNMALGDYLEITEAQLELGSVATDFEHRSYGEELALCQRYFETAYISIRQYASAGGNYIRPHIQFSTTKRVIPTLSWTATATGGVSYNGGNNQVREVTANPDFRSDYGGTAVYSYGFMHFDAEL